jgi:WD40 repeat protein
VDSVVFSPDGHTLATGSGDNTVLLWDLTDRTQPHRLGQPLTGHTSAVYSVVFSPDGHTLATGSGDNTVLLWDLTDRTQPRRLGQPLTGHILPVDSVVFSPDGHTLATGSWDLTVLLWDLTPLQVLRRDAVKEACTRAGGSLDETAWNVDAPGVSYQDTCGGH